MNTFFHIRPHVFHISSLFYLLNEIWLDTGSQEYFWNQALAYISSSPTAPSVVDFSNSWLMHPVSNWAVVDFCSMIIYQFMLLPVLVQMLSNALVVGASMTLSGRLFQWLATLMLKKFWHRVFSAHWIYNFRLWPLVGRLVVLSLLFGMKFVTILSCHQFVCFYHVSTQPSILPCW